MKKYERMTMEEAVEECLSFDLRVYSIQRRKISVGVVTAVLKLEDIYKTYKFFFNV